MLRCCLSRDARARIPARNIEVWMKAVESGMGNEREQTLTEFVVLTNPK